MSHNYDIISNADLDKYKLNILNEITKNIARICALDFFTADIVMDKKNNFFAVNYADAWPDMRRKSSFNDGVPDDVVEKAINRIIAFAKEKK